MRATLLLMLLAVAYFIMRAILLLALFACACWAEEAFGNWKMNPERSTFNGNSHPRSLTVRFEAHARGEVFTVDRIEADRRATASSTILYLDGKPRDFQDSGCSGTQSSRRLDNRTVEILRNCDSGRRTRLVRRAGA